MYTPGKVLIGGKGPVRKVALGGDAAVAIQTMWKQPLKRDTLEQTVRRIAELESGQYRDGRAGTGRYRKGSAYRYGTSHRRQQRLAPDRYTQPYGAANPRGMRG